MKPGDLIEWVYEDNGKVVPSNEVLYSSIMRKWVPIGGIALLISFEEKSKYTWLSEEGLFHVHVNDTAFKKGYTFIHPCIPRVIGDL